MPFVLRTVRQARWHKLPWLAPHDIQADAFGDFPSTANVVSVWRIEDNRANLERVVAALAAGRLYTHIDYAMVQESFLPKLGIEIVKTPGDTKDPTVNSEWHLHLVDLSGLELWRLCG